MFLHLSYCKESARRAKSRLFNFSPVSVCPSAQQMPESHSRPIPSRRCRLTMNGTVRLLAILKSRGRATCLSQWCTRRSRDQTKAFDQLPFFEIISCRSLLCPETCHLPVLSAVCVCYWCGGLYSKMDMSVRRICLKTAFK